MLVPVGDWYVGDRARCPRLGGGAAPGGNNRIIPLPIPELLLLLAAGSIGTVSANGVIRLVEGGYDEKSGSVVLFPY